MSALRAAGPLWAPWRRTAGSPHRRSQRAAGHRRLAGGFHQLVFGQTMTISPRATSSRFKHENRAPRAPPASRAATRPAAGRAAARNRGRDRSVLFSRRTVDRIFRRRPAEEDRRDGRRARSLRLRRTLAAARGARTTRLCSRPTRRRVRACCAYRRPEGSRTAGGACRRRGHPGVAAGPAGRKGRALYGQQRPRRLQRRQPRGAAVTRGARRRSSIAAAITAGISQAAIWSTSTMERSSPRRSISTARGDR